jgi:hypothetical protein
MAITNIGLTNSHQFAYNPILYKFDSTNKNQPGFRYVIELFDAGTSNLYVKQLIAPDPLDSNRCNVDLSRLLQNRVDKDIVAPTSINPTKSYYNYDIKVGESYTINWNFTGYVAGTNDSVVLNSSLNHTYVQNDQIVVQLTTVHNDNRDLMNGIWTVVEVISSTSIRISMKYSTIGFTTAGTTGTTTSATNNKFVDLNLFSLTNRRVWNGSQSPLLFMTEGGSLNNYVPTNDTRKILVTPVITSPNSSNIGNRHYNFERVWLNYYDPSNVVTKIRFTNDNGEEFDFTPSGTNIFKQINVGPGNLPTLTPILPATLPLIKPDTQFYKVSFLDVSNNVVLQDYIIVLNNNCSINDYSITYQDRFGSYQSFGFSLRELRNISTTKQSFVKEQILATNSDNVQVYHSEYKETLTLNTNWLTGEQNLSFEELLTSPYTYLYKGNQQWSVKVADGGSETTLQKNKRLHRRTINVEMNMVTNINI